MNIFMTGGSSAIGLALLRELLADTRTDLLYCAEHETSITSTDVRVRRITMDLATGEMPSEVDIVVHLAGLTRSFDQGRYWAINVDGTRRLAARAAEVGCRRFLYVSTRCATEGSGAYGESKPRSTVEAAAKGSMRCSGLPPNGTSSRCFGVTRASCSRRFMSMIL